MRTPFLTAALLAQVSAPPGNLTPMRARALVALAFGLISVVIGGLALRRVGPGRAPSVAAVVVGLVGVVLGGLHLAGTTGGFGTGQGRAGAIVALVVGLIGMALGGRALTRSGRTA